MNAPNAPQNSAPQLNPNQAAYEQAASPVAQHSSDGSGIPAKFGGDMNKFVNAYNELEKRLHTPQTNQPKSQPVQQQSDMSGFGDIEQRFYDNGGKLSPADRDTLVKAGFSERFIEAQERVFQQEITSLRDTLTKASGGVNPEEIIKFANANVGGKYSYQFLELVNQSVAEGRYGAWNEIVNDYKASVNQRQGDPNGGQYKQGNIGGFDGFKSTDEIRKAYADKRARSRDGEYMAQLKTRIESTDPNLLERFRIGQ